MTDRTSLPQSRLVSEAALATALPHLEHAVRFEGNLADAVRLAATTLDREEHRYVERFEPCPNGCKFEYLEPHGTHVRLAGPEDCDDCEDGFVEDDGTHVRLAGPEDCDDCEDGFVEDDDAPSLNPLIGALLLAGASLEAVPVWVAPLVRYVLGLDDNLDGLNGPAVPERLRTLLASGYKPAEEA